MDRDDQVHSVVRAMSVVEILNRQRVTSLECLHRKTGVPKPSLVRLLETLMAAGYVCRVSRREGYAVTDSVLRLSAGVRHRDVLVDVARPLMEAFTREHKWQVSLATHENGGMLIRATTRHISPFSRDELFLNRLVPVLGSVIGRAYFAFCPDDERELILEIAGDPESPDAAAAREGDRVAAMVQRARQRGYASDRYDRPGPYRSLGIPVMDTTPGGGILGSMVMFWYGSVMSREQAARRYLDLLYGLADRMATSLTARLQPTGDDHTVVPLPRRA
jgi:IclR family mhp operon transcriptional activator